MKSITFYRMICGLAFFAGTRYYIIPTDISTELISLIIAWIGLYGFVRLVIKEEE